MTTETITPATITREQAQAAFDAAKARQTAARAALNDAVAAVSNAKSSVMEADAGVLLARATLARLGGPIQAASTTERGNGQAQVQEAVLAILKAADSNGLTTDEIYNRLQAAGLEMAGANPAKNLSAYIARWSKVPGSGFVSAGRGRWTAEGAAPAAAAPEVPAFLAAQADVNAVAGVAEVPAFLADVAGVTEAPVEAQGSLTSLPEDFPGRAALADAGYTTIESVTGKTKDQLRRIKGIGANTAAEILTALEA